MKCPAPPRLLWTGVFLCWMVLGLPADRPRAQVQKVEVDLTHFSKGLTPADEGEDNHVVHVVLTR